MPVKITFIYHDNVQGISESWYSGASSVSGVTPVQIGNYVNARMAISGQQTVLDYVRASLVGSPRTVGVYLPSSLPAGTATTGQARSSPGVTGVLLNSDAAFTALLVRKSAPTSFARLFMRGIPDTIIDQGGQYLPDAGFIANFTAWANVVIANSWGWYGTAGNVPTRAGITNMVQNVNNHVTFTLDAPLFTPLEVTNGTRINVRITGQAQPNNINGSLVVIPGSTTTAATLRNQAITGFVAGSGRMTRVGKGVVTVTALAVERVVRRGAGRPFGLSAGRRRATVRG